MLFVIAAVQAGTLLGYTVGAAPPPGAGCISYGMGGGSCGPSVVGFAGFDFVGVQADTCKGLVTSVTVTRAADSAESAAAAAGKLRDALQGLGWALPAEPKALGKMQIWTAPPVDGVTASVATVPGLRPDQWAATASLRSGDGVCRE